MDWKEFLTPTLWKALLVAAFYPVYSSGIICDPRPNVWLPSTPH
ncbi:MAG: hypothetical protein WC263_02520 [Candidatus Micrarchaeia archaeon]